MKSERQCCVPGGKEGNLLSNAEDTFVFYPYFSMISPGESAGMPPPVQRVLERAFELGACQAYGGHGPRGE